MTTEQQHTPPKILYYDIEWRPAQAYIWQPWDFTVSPDMLIDAGGLLCFSAIWEGSKTPIFHSEWTDGHEGMVKALHSLLCEADVIITFNGDRYDIPKAMGEFVLAGLTPPPPPTSIDLKKVVKKLGFVMNRLAFIGPHLSVGKKVKHEGFQLWLSVMAGDTAAQNRMKKYCIQDSKLLVDLYKKVKPYINNHPFVGEREACGACNGKVLHSRGYRRTKSYKIQRLQCTSCGTWQDGKRVKLT